MSGSFLPSHEFGFLRTPKVTIQTRSRLADHLNFKLLTLVLDEINEFLRSSVVIWRIFILFINISAVLFPTVNGTDALANDLAYIQYEFFIKLNSPNKAVEVIKPVLPDSGSRDRNQSVEKCSDQ